MGKGNDDLTRNQMIFSVVFNLAKILCNIFRSFLLYFTLHSLWENVRLSKVFNVSYVYVMV